MSSLVSIFKKIAFEDFIPQYSGESPEKIIGKTKLHSDWVEDFKRQYQKKLYDSHNHGEYIPPITDTASYVMHGNGQLDELPRNYYHGEYITEIANDITPRYIDDTYADNDKYFRYKKQKDLMHYYELIHHLFNGGIRVHIYEKLLLITAYQVPNDSQLRMLHEIYNKAHVQEIHSELVSDGIGNDKKFYNFDSFSNYVHSLRSKVLEMTPEKRQKIEMLQRFRNQAEEPKLNIDNPRRPRRPQPQKTQTPIGTLNEQLVKNLNWPKGDKFKMPAVANIMTIIKTAEYFDANNRFEESDLILNLVNNYLVRST